MKNYITSVQIIFLFCFLLSVSKTSGQCPTSSFTVSSPVCTGSALQITNNSTGANEYKWDFTPGFFSQPAVKLTDTLLNLAYPGDITLTSENDTNIVFISGFGDGKMHRIIYGNGPENPITSAENLGNFGVLYQPTDIALFREDSTWFGLIVDYGSNYLYRIRFGNSLKNTPDSVVTVLTNVASGFVNPWSIKLTTDSTGEIFGLVGNHAGGSISILSFGNSIRNIPTVNAPVAVPGTTYVQDAILAKSCGNWFAFLAGNNSSKIIQASFGNSLLNTPTFNAIITNGGTPSDLVLVEDSSHFKLIYTDFNSFDIKKYDLGSDLNNCTPVYLGSDYFNGQNPKGICSSRKDNTTFIYVLYSSNNVETFGYSNSVNVNTSLSSDFTPNNIVFTQSGTYPITLRVSDANGNSSSFTDTVLVTPAPNTNFAVTDKCFGDLTSFIDSSVLSDGIITSWKWYFDDGDSSSSQNNTHTYADTGSYDIKLITSSSFGCFDTLITIIDITPRPQAAFSTPPAVCSETFMQFTDQSTVSAGSINAWNWHFGNGDSSGVQNPVYSFPVDGYFYIDLTVTTANGCSDSTSIQFSVNARPKANFIADNTCLGQTVLFTDLTTVNNSTINNFAWNFGDGDIDNTVNPSHAYAAVVSTYPVQLVTTAVNGCIDTALQVIKINNFPNVSFSSQPSTVCMNNDVNFTDLSTVIGDTISGWLWDFGDNSFDTTANPVHQYANSGIYSVSLIAYSPSRCPGTVFQQNIDVKESPVASFDFSTTCEGNSTQFTNNSIAAPGSSIDSIRWMFGPSDSTSISNPDFTFSANGNYPVTLTVISPEGCSSTDSMNVPVYSRPVSNFTHSLPCTGDSVRFTNTSTRDSISTITQYEWSFGDLASGINNYSALQNPVHKYNSTSTFIVSLITTTNHDCRDTTFKSFTVNQSPSSQFTYSPTCLGDLMEFFNPGSALDSLYSWDFGDSQWNQLKEPAHYYAFAGTYNVKLQVTTRMGCRTEANKLVTVSPIPAANFIATSACVNTDYQFQDNSFISTGSIIRWKWNIAGLPKPDSIQNPQYLFPDTGNFNTTLTITSDIGCAKTITKVIDVNSLPVSSFSFDPQFGNPPLDIQTTDFSTDGSSFEWDFGDGSAIENLQESSHIYNDTGLFTITQYVTSQFGCKDTSSQFIYVIKPIHDIAVTGDSSYFDGNYFHVVGRIENHGTREITSLQMETRLENGNTIRENLIDNIPNGSLGFYTYPFHASFFMNEGTEFTYYCIKAQYPNGFEDDVPENNERCFNLTDDIISIDPFPNPFTNNVTLRILLPKPDELKIELTDMSGKKIMEIFEGKVSKNIFEKNIDLSELKEGIYSVNIIYRDRVISRNIMKNKTKD